MDAGGPLRSFVLQLFPGLFHKLRPALSGLAPVTPEEPTPEGEWRAIAELVSPGSTVVNVGDRDARLYESVPATSCLRSVPVGRPLDSLFAALRPPVDFVRCDAPEAALRTLRSAGVLLRRSKPAWRIRISGNPDDPAHSAHAAFHLFRQRAYAAYVWDGNRFRLRRSEDRAGWYFFFTPRHVRRLPANLIADIACRAA